MHISLAAFVELGEISYNLYMCRHVRVICIRAFVGSVHVSALPCDPHAGPPLHVAHQFQMAMLHFAGTLRQQHGQTFCR